MNNDASVIIDPVLCYVSNHRKLVPDEYLGSIINQYFANGCISDAYELLYRRTAPLLATVADDCEGTTNTDTAGSIEAILRIFHSCELHRITLPDFAVIDLKKLPPPPTLNSDRIVLRPSEVVSTSPKFNAGDSIFNRRALSRIMKELKQLKSVVVDLSTRNRETHSTVASVMNTGFVENCVRPSDNKTKDDRPCSNDSEIADDSPPADGPRSVEDQHPPSRGSSVSVSRTAASTPPKKRGSSRSSSSIEEAVAKIKAQRCGTLYQGYPNDSCPSKTPSPNVEMDDRISSSGGTKTPDPTPIICDTTHVKTPRDTLFPSALAPSLFFPGGIPRFDLAAATLMARMFPNSAAGMIGGSLSPQGQCVSAFSTPMPAHQKQPMERFFAPPTSNVGLLLRQREQHQKLISALTAAGSMAKTQHMDGKPKKAIKRPITHTTVGSDTNVVRKKLHHSKTEADESMAADNLSNEDTGNDANKPYECSHANCHKRFANKFLLKKHEFIHSGLRPYQCPYCFKRFNRKDNLLRHKGTHEANEPNISKVRRRRCRLFGVKGSMTSTDNSPSDAAGTSVSSPPVIDMSKTTGQRPSSCVPSSDTDTNRQSTPNSAPVLPFQPPPSTSVYQRPANLPGPAEFSLAALISYNTALAQSNWPRPTMDGIRSLND